ncbi:NAD(P)H-binding protein [soil metagenome]
MKILVVGASRGTGALCVKSALAKGHTVSAFARTPSKLALVHDRLVKVTGDFHDAASIRAAMPGHDAVIVTASIASLSELETKPDYFSRGTRLCIDAMKEVGVKRLVVLSAQGAGDSRAAASWFLRTFIIGGILKRAFADHDVQEKLTRDSGLAWVIARPTRLTNGAARGRYTRNADPAGHVPSSISRADVANFLVESCELDPFVEKAVALGG